MVLRTRLTCLVAAIGMAAAFAGTGFAQPTRSTRIPATAAAAGTVIAGELRGGESADYVIEGAAGPASARGFWARTGG